MILNFSKYSGCGNDFILIDNRNGAFSFSKDLIKRLCLRKQGVGADGLILLENSNSCNFRMRIYNADGSEAEMCGNGIRCLGKFLSDLGFTEPYITIETMEREILLSISEDSVTVNMGPAGDIRWNQSLCLEGKFYTFDYMNTGVPHAVIFDNEIEMIQVKDLGQKLRRHPVFSPRGANINFAQNNQGTIRIRTYERGVEDETLACGTGAAAAAFTAFFKFKLPTPIKIVTRSDETLYFDFEEGEKNDYYIKMTGPANFLFKGECSLGF